jgi:predicted nucleotidyltransferase
MEDRAAVEQALRVFFAKDHHGVVAAYLFGSVARGTRRPGSDVDIAVLYPADPPVSLAGLPLDLEAELERLLGAPVQVVILNRAPVDLIHRVLRDGALLVDRDRSARIRFEVKARNEFFDLQPILARYRAGPAPGR